MEGDEIGCGEKIAKEVLSYINGTRYLVIERCVQCPVCETKEGKHTCMRVGRDCGRCDEPIPEWCHLPLLDGIGEG